MAAAALVSAAAAIFCANAYADDYPPVFSNDRNQFVILEPTKKAPETRLTNLAGASARLSQYSGKIVLLNFWASWCAPCAAEMPDLDALAASLPKERFAVVAVSLDQDDGRGVRAFLTRQRLRHVTVLLDPLHRLGALSYEQAQPERLAVRALPTTYVLDQRGQVRGYLTGPADWTSRPARALVDYFLGQQQ